MELTEAVEPEQVGELALVARGGVDEHGVDAGQRAGQGVLEDAQAGQGVDQEVVVVVARRPRGQHQQGALDVLGRARARVEEDRVLAPARRAEVVAGLVVEAPARGHHGGVPAEDAAAGQLEHEGLGHHVPTYALEEPVARRLSDRCRPGELPRLVGRVVSRDVRLERCRLPAGGGRRARDTAVGRRTSRHGTDRPGPAAVGQLDRGPQRLQPRRETGHVRRLSQITPTPGDSPDSWRTERNPNGLEEAHQLDLRTPRNPVVLEDDLAHRVPGGRRTVEHDVVLGAFGVDLHQLDLARRSCHGPVERRARHRDLRARGPHPGEAVLTVSRTAVEEGERPLMPGHRRGVDRHP